MFCENCREEVQFSNIEERIATSIVDNKIYEYIEKTIHCLKCGSFLYDEDVEASNLWSFQEEYRKRNMLISIEELNKLLEIYNTTPKKISTYLKWDENDYDRYLNGDMPSISHSRKLMHMLIFPESYHLEG